MALSKPMDAAKCIGYDLRKKKQHSTKDEIFDIHQSCAEAKMVIRKPTGIVYDDKMTEHKCLWDPKYPERPERYTVIMNRCEELGLLSRCERIISRKAERSELLRLHSSHHVNNLEHTDNCQDVQHLEHICTTYDSIFLHPSTYECALIAAGSAINLVDAICENKIQNGMAIVRPPGHHAMMHNYCGFCFFNNVALAANHAINKFGFSRILIVDWDVHHGQATQQMFSDDPRVLYFSIHRYENGTFWPNLMESDCNFVGIDNGKGFNFNVPLNKTGLGDADYLAIFHNILLPMATEFQPQLILISAGYDAALGCPEGEMKVTPACYAHLASSLTGLAGGKVAVVLEGGYCLKSLAEGAALTLRALLGDPCPMIETLSQPSQSIRETILNVIYAHRNYWSCFKLQGRYSICDVNICEDGKQKFRHLPSIRFNYNGRQLKVYPTRECYPIFSEVIAKGLDNQLNALILEARLLLPCHKVCFVFDRAMLQHKNLTEPDHPESPERIVSIFNMFNEYELLDRLHWLPRRLATEEELLTVHDKEYIERIAKLKTVSTAKELDYKANKYNSVYFHQQTYNAACVAAGSLLEVVDSVLNSESGSGVAVIRPPGHHASDDEACGFCIFNNVAIAAKYAVNVHGIKRVLIVDWDVHHGNGIQNAFESDPSVLYISLHRFEDGRFFPAGPEGGHTYVGVNKGVGYNVNIPWNEKGIGNVEYVAAFHQIVLPIAYQFNPELILVAAGFDAIADDPLGGCKLTPDVYSYLSHWLMPLANGKVILCLEGGYNVRSISYALTMCTKTLLGDPLPIIHFDYEKMKSSAIKTLRKVMSVQSQYWPCLAFLTDLPEESILPTFDKLSFDDNGRSMEFDIKFFQNQSTFKCANRQDQHTSDSHHGDSVLDDLD